jgi:predicted esterase
MGKEAKTIATGTHGRYLVSRASTTPAPRLVGFHGYAETADAQLERLRAIPGAERWSVVSIQGLNRFYERRSDEVIAGWMTRQDRELAIADNLAYVAAVVRAEWGVHAAPEGSQGPQGVVFAGFSQGVAMAFRAAAASAQPVIGVIAAGGDIPPELERTALGRLGHALVCRGAGDRWYSAATFASDLARLRDATVQLTAVEFDGGHEWSDAVVRAASTFLGERA